MSAVWFQHPGDRIITAAQWASAGVAGASDTVWSKSNNWSIPASSLTAPQIAILAADGGFNTVAPDGPNSVRSGSSGATNATTPATKADIDAAILQAGTLDSTSPLARLLHAVTNPLRRQHRSPVRLGPVSTDITSAANNATVDATLVKSYLNPVTGITNNQCRALTAAELKALPFDPGAGKPQVFSTGGFGYVLNSAGTANIDTGSQPGGIWPYMPLRSIRFMTDADKVDVLLYALLGNTISSYQVFIDGVPQSLTPTVMTGVLEYVHLIFPSAKTRLVEIRTDCLVGPMYCKTIYKLWQPAPVRGPRVMVVGASYTQPWVYNGTSGAQTLNGQGMYQMIADWLDIEDLWVEGVGGTGFIQRASGGMNGPNNNYMDRILGVTVVAKPDVLVIDTAFSNDSFNGNSSAAIVAAANAYVTAVRAALPNCKIILLNGIRAPLYGDFSANYAACIAGLQALRQDLYFVDMSAWLDMAGYIPAHATGTGNSDVYIGNDGVHPTVEGHAYLRARLAPILQRLIFDDGRLLNTVLTS